MSAELDPEASFPTGVTIRYPRSPLHRVIHVDGALGGAVPNGSGVQISFYSERFAPPDWTEHDIGADGSMSPKPRASASGEPTVIRELEVAMVMGVTTATALRDWLDKTLEAIAAAAAQERGKGRAT